MPGGSVILSEEYQDLLLMLSKYFRSHGTTDAIQIIKLQEEVGEVAESYIGFLALNPRKGRTHTAYDVAMECADVAITALLAIAMIGFSPDEILADQLAKTRRRIDETPMNSGQGSVSNEL